MVYIKSRSHLLIFVLATLAIVGVQCDDELIDVEQYTINLSKNLIPEGYDKTIRPKYGKEPEHVNISLLINDISSISEHTMDFRIDFDIRHFFNDKRLAFPVKHNVTEIVMEEAFAKKIWIPDTYFVNTKELNFHKTVADEDTALIRVSANGDVTYITKIYMLAKCSMDLTYFPIDQQKCSIMLGSYGKSTKEVVFNWRNDSRAIEFSFDMILSTFHLVGYNRQSIFKQYLTGTYNYLQLDLVVCRSIDFYIARVYVPACLVVFISWLPFWLDRNDHHARVALGVTTVLTMTTLITNTNSDLPKISHLTALDVYLFFCFLLVFLSLIEYATVGYYDTKMARVAKAMADSELKPAKKKDNLIEDTSIIDYGARRLFPLTFLLFNVAYIVALYCIAFLNSHAKVQVKL